MVDIIPSKVVPIDSIFPNKWNPNVMKDETFKLLLLSIAELGFCQAVLVTKDMTIIDGEHRWRAMKDSGATKIEVKIIDIEEDRAKEGTVNLNALRGELDKKKLGELIIQLEQSKGKEYVQGRLAIDREAYNTAIARAQEGTSQKEPENELPEPETDISPGDCFRLGKHMLVCGDCTDTELLNKAFSGDVFSLMVTDPPYNVCEFANVDFYNENNSLSIKRLDQHGWDEGFEPKKFLDVALGFSGEDSTWYVFTSHMLAPEIWEWMRGFLDSDNFCVWCKPNPMPNLSKKYYGSAVEIICYGTKGKPTFNVGNGVDPNYFIVNKGSRGLHPSEKPVSIIEPLILHSSNPGDIVFDPFAGSGTTLIVCEQLGRRCISIEKDTKYVQTIIDRWEALTEKEAVKLNG